jgi:hypothetical protein
MLLMGQAAQRCVLIQLLTVCKSNQAKLGGLHQQESPNL